MKKTGPSVPVIGLRRRESVRQGLLRLATTYLELAREQPQRPADELVAAVHTTRLVLKRLRSVYRLLESTLPAAAGKRERNRLRAAASGLAGAREASVCSLTLIELEKEVARDDVPHVAQVREALTRLVPARTHQPAGVRRALGVAVRAAELSVRTLQRSTWSGHGWKILEAGFHASYRKARRRFKESHPTSGEPSFHAWRTAAKSLLYQLHIVDLAARPRLRALKKSLDRLQDQLGLENDLAEVGELVRKHAPRLGGPEAVERTKSLVTSRQLHLRKLALKDGRRLFAARPGEFVDGLHRDWKRWRK